MTSATNGRDLLQLVEAAVYGVGNADAQALYQRLCQAESILLDLSHPVSVAMHMQTTKLSTSLVDHQCWDGWMDGWMINVALTGQATRITSGG